MALPPEEMSMSSVFLAPVCLVTQPPREARGKREWAHSYAGSGHSGLLWAQQDVWGWGSLQGRTRAGDLWLT